MAPTRPWYLDNEPTLVGLRRQLTSIQMISLIFQELNLWKHRWRNIKANERPQNLAETLLSIDEITFPDLFVVLQIAATLPVTSCEGERSFSVMHRLRTWLRASVTSERLSALALMNIHYGHSE